MSYADPNDPWWDDHDPEQDGKLAAYIIVGVLILLLGGKLAGLL